MGSSSEMGLRVLKWVIHNKGLKHKNSFFWGVIFRYYILL